MHISAPFVALPLHHDLDKLLFNENKVLPFTSRHDPSNNATAIAHKISPLI
jgi:hypothetical protein